MSEELTRAKEIDDAVKAADAKKRADAEEAAMAGEKLDRILDCMNELGKRMDAYEAERAPAKKEEGDDEDEGEIKEKGDPRPLGADSSRKDSVRADSAADEEEIANYRREHGAAAAHRIVTDNILGEIQSHADKAATAWGKSAVHPWDGETITAYRRRTAREHQQHSPAWKSVDLRSLSGQSLRNATAQIFADSIKASASMESYDETLREVRRRDPVTGQTRIEFYGSPSAWTNQFKSGARYVTAFRTPGWRQS
jgi:hypothetical protein